MISEIAREAAAKQRLRNKEISEETDFMYFKGICPHCAGSISSKSPLFKPDLEILVCNDCGLERTKIRWAP